MFQRPNFHITVTGGSVEENMQVTSLIHESLVEKGFKNLGINHQDRVITQPGVTVYDMIRAMNPDLLDSSIQVSGESEDDLQASAAGMQYLRPMQQQSLVGELYQPVWLS